MKKKSWQVKNTVRLQTLELFSDCINKCKYLNKCLTFLMPSGLCKKGKLGSRTERSTFPTPCLHWGKSSNYTDPHLTPFFCLVYQIIFTFWLQVKDQDFLFSFKHTNSKYRYFLCFCASFPKYCIKNIFFDRSAQSLLIPILIKHHFIPFLFSLDAKCVPGVWCDSTKKAAFSSPS